MPAVSCRSVCWPLQVVLAPLPLGVWLCAEAVASVGCGVSILCGALAAVADC